MDNYPSYLHVSLISGTSYNVEYACFVKMRKILLGDRDDRPDFIEVKLIGGIPLILKVVEIETVLAVTPERFEESRNVTSAIAQGERSLEDSWREGGD